MQTAPNVKVLRKVIARRKRDPEDVAEEEELLELYLTAVGGHQEKLV